MRDRARKLEALPGPGEKPEVVGSGARRQMIGDERIVLMTVALIAAMGLLYVIFEIGMGHFEKPHTDWQTNPLEIDGAVDPIVGNDYDIIFAEFDEADIQINPENGLRYLPGYGKTVMDNQTWIWIFGAVLAFWVFMYLKFSGAVFIHKAITVGAVVGIPAVTRWLYNSVRSADEAGVTITQNDMLLLVGVTAGVVAGTVLLIAYGWAKGTSDNVMFVIFVVMSGVLGFLWSSHVYRYARVEPGWHATMASAAWYGMWAVVTILVSIMIFGYLKSLTERPRR